MKPADLWKRGWLVPAGLLSVALAVKMAWIGAYPVHNDELISLEAVKGIAEYGIPLLETGKFYWRSLISHYLLAVPYLFGADDVFPGRAVSIVFNILAAGCLYRIARSLADHAAPAILAALMFLSSSLINLNSYLLRDYATFNFFALATAWYAYRHFIAGEADSFKFLVILTPLLAGSHDLSVGMLPLLVVGAGYACSKQPGYFTRYRWRLAGYFLLVLAAFVLFVWYRPPNAQYAGAALEMKPGGMGDKWFIVRELRDYAPYALIFLVPGLLYGVLRQRPAWLYWGGTILWLALFLSLVSPMANSRYFIHLVALAIAFGVCSAWRVGCRLALRCRREGWLIPTLFVMTAIGASLGISTVDAGRPFGFSYRYLDAAPVHAFVAGQVPDNALLLSMQPGLTEYHLERRPDYFLREKVVEPGRAWTEFSAEEKAFSKYRTLDSANDLIAVAGHMPGRPVCIIVDYLFDYSLSPAMRHFIHRNFALVYKDDQRFAVFLAGARP